MSEPPSSSFPTSVDPDELTNKSSNATILEIGKRIEKEKHQQDSYHPELNHFTTDLMNSSCCMVVVHHNSIDGQAAVIELLHEVAQQEEPQFKTMAMILLDDEMNGQAAASHTTTTTTTDWNESIVQLLSSYPRDGSLGYGWVKPTSKSPHHQSLSSSVPSFPTSPLLSSLTSSSSMSSCNSTPTSSSNTSSILSSFIITNSSSTSLSSSPHDNVEQQSHHHQQQQQQRLWNALQTYLPQISLRKPHTSRLIATISELARLEEAESLRMNLPITSSVFDNGVKKPECIVKPLFTSVDDWKAIEREFSDILNLALPSHDNSCSDDCNHDRTDLPIEAQLKTELNRLLMDFEEFLCLLPPIVQCLCDRSQLHCCICGCTNYGFARDLILRHQQVDRELCHSNEILLLPSFSSTLKGKKLIAEKKKEMKMDLLKKQQQRPENLHSMIMPQFFLHPSSLLSSIAQTGSFGALSVTDSSIMKAATESGLQSSSMNPVLSIPSTFCCGVTFEIFFRVFTEKRHPRLQDFFNIQELLKIKRDWFCEKQDNAAKDDDSYKEGCYKALMSRGLGKHVNNIFEAKQGDFVQFWRVNGTGHSVIFMGLKEDEITFEYWSSQRSTNGVGFNTESLSGVERFHIVRLV
nr:unnamed protein product [Naegleria fowleri]